MVLKTNKSTIVGVNRKAFNRVGVIFKYFIMKKKFLIPCAAAFMMVLAFSFGSNANTSDTESSNLFVESDNIAFAESGGCLYRGSWYCFPPNAPGKYHHVYHP